MVYTYKQIYYSFIPSCAEVEVVSVVTWVLFFYRQTQPLNPFLPHLGRKGPVTMKDVHLKELQESEARGKRREDLQYHPMCLRTLPSSHLLCRKGVIILKDVHLSAQGSYRYETHDRRAGRTFIILPSIPVSKSIRVKILH